MISPSLPVLRPPQAPGAAKNHYMRTIARALTGIKWR
jgi:hypothetical protein